MVALIVGAVIIGTVALIGIGNWMFARNHKHRA